VQKRIVDFLFASGLLLVLWPILVVASLLIKLDSPGPVFFSQKRIGRGSKLFRIWKLRTMRKGSEGPGYTLGADSRVTRVGRWLRWYKVDELPQLWNIVVGDMSLVGPRPVLPELTEGFEQAYLPLLRVLPGLTDPATLKYCREEENLSLVANQDLYMKTVIIPDKVRLSASYLERATLRSDLWVLVETALALAPVERRPRLMGAGLPGRSKGARPLFPGREEAEG
jgi:lipopolysaccharide/colanic/teichoic acid biosynthesis glycosyltransferase